MIRSRKRTFLSNISALVILTTCLYSNAQAQRLEDWQSLEQLRAGDLSISDDHFISTWVTGNFTTSQGGSQIFWGEGDNSASDFDWLWFSYGQGLPYTGYDIGVGRTTSSQTVADLSTLEFTNGWTSPAYDRTVKYKFTHDLKPSENGSFWWMGPKTIIYSYPTWGQNPAANNDRLEGQYEVYIVTDSSISRQELASRANLTEIGSGWYGQGASRDLYHHYTTTLPFRGTDGSTKYIFQVWTIKDNYMSEVEVPVNHIQRYWMNNNLVPWNFFNLGWKLNLETSGRFDFGWGNFEQLILPSNEF